MLKQMPYVQEYQGEAKSWSGESLGYYTVYESKSKKPSNIYYYRMYINKIISIRHLQL